MHPATIRVPDRGCRAWGRRSALMAALLFVATPGIAQPQKTYPDLLVSWFSNLLYGTVAVGIDLIPGNAFLDPYPSRYRGMQRMSFSGQWSWAPCVDLDNSSTLLAVYLPTGATLARVSRGGTMTPVTASGAALVTPSGDYLVGASMGSGWGLIHPDGSNFRLLFDPLVSLGRAVWDEDTGDLIAIGYGPRSEYLGLLRCTMSGVVTTVSPRPPTWGGAEYDPRTGDFFAAHSNYPSYSANVARIPRGGGPFSTIAQDLYAGYLRFAPDGDLYAAGNGGIFRLSRRAQGPWPVQVLLWNPYFCLPQPIPCGSTFTYTGLDMDRSRNLSGRGAYGPGSAYQLILSFPKDGLLPYQGAASLAIRPGLQAGSHWIPLSPDALFAASLTTPSIFSNFSGVLSAGGAGSATLNIPNRPALRGVRIFLAFVTWQPGQGIRTVSNVLGITIGANI